MSSCICRSLRDLLGDLLAALVAALAGLAVELVEAPPLRVDDVAQLLGDVVVDAAEVVLLERVAPLAAELLEHLPDALDALAVAVAEPDCIIRRSAAFRSPWYSRSSVISSRTPSASSSKPTCVPSQRE